MGFGKASKKWYFYDLNKGEGPGVLNFWGVLVTIFFVLKTFRNATKHKISSFNMKGDVISDRFLML